MKKYLLLAAIILLCSSAMPTLAQDFSKVEIKVTKVAGNVYMLEGSGGNIGVSVGPDGILIVDDQFAPLADKIKAALKTLGEGKLKFVLNTHYHGDHTGGNIAFGPDAPIIAQTNVRKRLSEEQKSKFFNRTTPASPKEALPVITFDNAVSVFFNGEEVKVVHFLTATLTATASSSLPARTSCTWAMTSSTAGFRLSILKQAATWKG